MITSQQANLSNSSDAVTPAELLNDSTDALPLTKCKKTCASTGKKKSDENFPVGSFLIARSIRKHVKAYYNFARASDDIADSPYLTPEQKIKRLDAMQAVLEGKLIPLKNQPDVYSSLILSYSLTNHGIPVTTASDLLIAFRQDIHKTRYANFRELLHYCRYSAHPVGRFLLLLHDEKSSAFPASDALCTALQILNHLQDCANDLRILNRCYLPQDWMRETGALTSDLLQPNTSGPLRLVFDKILDKVDILNSQARALPHHISNWRMRLEAAIIVNLCVKLSAKLRAQDPLSDRIKLSKMDGIMSVLSSFHYLVRRITTGSNPLSKEAKLGGK